MENSIPIFSEIRDESVNIDFLFWIGCAGRFDDIAKNKIALFIKILQKCEINFAILGNEEKCTGDVAKRVGNEYLFQLMALQNISIFEKYNIKNILTTCPHCFNTFKNEYPELGGDYNVIFYTDFLLKLIKEGKLKVDKDKIKKKRITFHDPCYLGRGNGDYNTVRELIGMTEGDFIELKRSKDKSFCCGAGGGQIFKESENGNREVSKERIEEIQKSESNIVALACPFCSIMLREDIKNINVIDILDALF